MCLSLSFILFVNCNKCIFAGYTEPLDKNTEIVVPEDDYGLYAIDILDPSIVISSLFVVISLLRVYILLENNLETCEILTLRF